MTISTKAHSGVKAEHEQKVVEAPRKRRRVSTLQLQRVVLFVLLIAAWQLATAIGGIDPVILPGPAAVVDALWQASVCNGATCGVQGYFLWQHVLATLERVLVGVLGGSVIGLAIGWWLGTRPRARAIVEPYLSFLRALPPLGYIGLLIVWFGIGDVSKVVLLLLAVVPTVTVSTILGVTGVQRDWILAARTLGATNRQVFRKVLLPAAAPQIINGVRLATGMAWACIVAAEMNDGIPGIGGLAYISGTQLNTAVTIGSIIVIGVVALAMDAAYVGVEKRFSIGRGL